MTATAANPTSPVRWRQVLTGLLLCFLAIWLIPSGAAAQALDCAGYDSQIWAQSVYDLDPATYAALDPDGNGWACEELQPGAAPALWTNEIPAGCSACDGR